MFRTILHLDVAFDVLLSLSLSSPPASLSRSPAPTGTFNYTQCLTMPVNFIRRSTMIKWCISSSSSLLLFASLFTQAHYGCWFHFIIFLLLLLLSTITFATAAPVFTMLLWLSFVVFFLVLLLFACGCSLVSLLRYLSIWSEKNIFAFLSFLIFPLSYPFCVFVVMIPLLLILMAPRMRYILFCLPSLMMFAIYIKIQCARISSFLKHSAAPSPPSPKAEAATFVRTECGRATKIYYIYLTDIDWCGVKISLDIACTDKDDSPFAHTHILCLSLFVHFLPHILCMLVYSVYCQMCHAHTNEMMNQKWWFQTR